MKVVKVGVGNEHEIDQGHEIEIKAWLALAFNDAVPLGPVGIDDHRVVRELHQKCGVADPGDSDLASLRRVGDGSFAGAVALLKCLGEEPVPEKVVIPSRPAFFRKDPSVISAVFLLGFVGVFFGHVG